MSPSMLGNSLRRTLFRPRRRFLLPYCRIQTQASHPAPQGIRARLKHLTDNYGWAAVGVYAALSVIDLSALFITVRLMGADTVGHYEHLVLKTIGDVLGYQPSAKHDTNVAAKTPSLWTEVALAYGIHKLLIVFRVPLTAAVTPPLVKYLRRKGYNIGKKVVK